MRNLLALIVIAVAGYYGYKYWQEHPEVVGKYIPALAKATPEPEPAPEGGPASTHGGDTKLAIPRAVATPPPFASKIAAADAAAEKMPPGVFLVVERASVETKDGVIAVVPGDKVSLLERRNDGTLKVTDGKVDFVVRETQVTQDIAAAQAAEKADWAKRYGTLPK
jgi:hypothetical protein